MRTLPAVLLATLLAGCLSAGSEGDGDEAAAPTPSDEVFAAATDSPTVGPGNGTVNESLVEVPVSYDGETHTAACVHVVVHGTCQFAHASSTSFRDLAIEGRPARLVATVTWTADPLHPEMNVIAFTQLDDGEWYWFEGFPVRQGPPPIEIDWGLEMLNGTGLMLGIHAFDGYGNDVAFVGGETSIPFHVEGTVTVRGEATP